MMVGRNKNVPSFTSGGITPYPGTVDEGFLIPVFTPNGLWGTVQPSALGGAGVLNVKAFGAQGDGRTDDTRALKRAHAALAAACAAGYPMELQYPAGVYKITDTLDLPDASAWSVRSLGGVTLRMAADNKPIFQMLVTSYRSAWSIKGTFTFSYVNNQPAANTRAVCIALGCSIEVIDGIYDWEIDDVIFTNGFRGLAVHPDTLTANFKCPFWGYIVKSITSYTGMTGATMALYSPNLNVGAPRATIWNFYCQGLNATEPRLILKGYSGLEIINAELNQGSGQQVLLESNRQVNIHTIRLEAASTSTPGYRGIEISGSGTQCIIQNAEIQSFTCNVGAGSEAYFINANGSYVEVHNVGADSNTITSGSLYMTSVSSGGTVRIYGTFYRNNEGASTRYYPISPSPQSFMPSNVISPQFWMTGVNAGLAFVTMSNGEADNEWVVPMAGYLIGIVVYVNNAVTTGPLTVTAYKNGAAVAGGQFAAVINAGNTGSRYHCIFKGFFTPGDSHRYVANDKMTMRLSTDAAFAPTGNTVKVAAIFAVTQG